MHNYDTASPAPPQVRHIILHAWAVRHDVHSAAQVVMCAAETVYQYIINQYNIGTQSISVCVTRQMTKNESSSQGRHTGSI